MVATHHSLALGCLLKDESRDHENRVTNFVRALATRLGTREDIWKNSNTLRKNRFARRGFIAI